MMSPFSKASSPASAGSKLWSALTLVAVARSGAAGAGAEVIAFVGALEVMGVAAVGTTDTAGTVATGVAAATGVCETLGVT
jgi:hypothetical protein